MANEKTITSANAVALLTVAPLGFTAVQLQGFAADAAFSMDGADIAETRLGVDGRLSAGWVPRIYRQTWSFQPDSDSIALFDAIAGAQDAGQTIFRLGMVIRLPATARSYDFFRGVLKNYKVMPDAKRVLDPVNFVIEWERVRPSVVG